MDSVTITEGAGTSVGVDVVGANRVQVVKPAFGTDGVATFVSAAAGLPVEIVAGAVSLSGEDHIGGIGFATKVVTPTMTMDTTPDYATGDVYGDKTELTDAVRLANGGGLLSCVTAVDRDNVSPTFDLLLFDSDPSASTWTDNAAPTFAAADASKLIARIPFPSSFAGAAWATVGSYKVGTATTNLEVKAAGGTAHLYVVPIAQAAINVATATHLVLRFVFRQY